VLKRDYDESGLTGTLTGTSGTWSDSVVLTKRKENLISTSTVLFGTVVIVV
jgi:hypothetical protein